MTELHFGCACGATFRLRRVNRTFAEGTCPDCKSRVQVSLERES